MSTGSGTQMTEREAEQVERANSSGRSPVAFIHGLWLLPSSWDRWVELFDEAGYAAITPGWPDDPATVEEARAHPEVFAHKGVGQIADYLDGIIRRLSERPAVIGHSFGGLLTEIIGVAGSLPSRSRSAPRPSGVWCRFRSPPCAPRCRSCRTPPIAVGHRDRHIQAPEAQPGGYRDREAPSRRARADDRQRMARSRRHGARVRPPLHLAGRKPPTGLETAMACITRATYPPLFRQFPHREGQ